MIDIGVGNTSYKEVVARLHSQPPTQFFDVFLQVFLLIILRLCLILVL